MPTKRSKNTAPSRNGKNNMPNVTSAADDQSGKTHLPVVNSGRLESSPTPEGSSAIRDYPTPTVLTQQRLFIYDADLPAAVLFPRLGMRLAASGDIFRVPTYGAGLMLVLRASNHPPIPVDSAKQLGAIILDRVPVIVIKDGKPKGRIPAGDLDVALRSELFLQQFRPVDLVVHTPVYLRNYKLSEPGYNDAGRGQRVVYTGKEPAISHTPDTINRFLDTMQFANSASRTNALGAALLVQLRLLYPGQLPVILATANKSQAGKDTVLDFATASSPCRAISYERTDWAVEKCFVQQLKASPDTAVVRLENVRLDACGQVIASSFLERFSTSAQVDLNAIGTGLPVRIWNYIVLMMSVNSGLWSTDLMNRSWTIELECRGNVADRHSPIGSPRHEFLPRHQSRIEAELRGLVQKWLDAGRPLDTAVKHPFLLTSQTIGGILKVCGYDEFLGNYTAQRTADDPVRQALGNLGASMPNEWLTASAWLPLVTHLGLVNALIPKNDRESPESRRRGLGVTLSSHEGETFVVQTDDEAVSLRLEKGRRRFERGEPETRYRFVSLDKQKVPDSAGK